MTIGMSEPARHVLTTAEELRKFSQQLAQNARRQLTIFTPDLEFELYHQEEFVHSTLQLLKRSRHTQVRILIQDTRPAREAGHGLLRLLRHTDGQFQIRKLTVETQMQQLAYLVSDDLHLLRRQNSGVFEGLCYTHDRARAKDQLEEFELLWSAAVSDPDLRTLSL